MSILIESMRSLLIQFPPASSDTRRRPAPGKCVVASPHTLSRTPSASRTLCIGTRLVQEVTLLH